MDDWYTEVESIPEPVVRSSVLSICKSYLLDKSVHLINVKRRRKKRWLISQYLSNLPPHPLLVVWALSQDCIQRLHEQEMAQQVMEASTKHVRLGLSPCDSMVGGEN